MVVRQSYERYIYRSCGSSDEVNITKGCNKCKTIVCSCSVTADTRPLNVARFTDVKATMVDETPPSSNASKPVGVGSSTILLSMRPSSSECDQ